VISVFLSLVNYVPFAFLTNLTDVTKAGSIVFKSQYLVLLILISIGVGVTVGILFQVLLNRRSASGSLWNYIVGKAKNS
jgi:hypothetical protein